MKSIVKNSFYQLLVIYASLITISFLGIISRFTLHFEIFAIILAVLGYTIIDKKEETVNKKLHHVLLILSLMIALIFRVIPYLKSKIPLGYDTGIYKYVLESELSNLDNWIILSQEPLFLYLIKPLTYLFSANFIMTWLFIIFNLLLGLSIYYFTREYFGKRSAIISLIVFSISTVQFITFTFMYYRNILGLSLMLLALVFFNKSGNKKYRILFIILGGLVGAVHRPTFFIFGISYLFYSIYHFREIKHNMVNGVLVLVVFFSFYIGRFWPAITNQITPVTEGFVNPGQFSGSFITFFQYQFLTLTYLSFAILGLIYLLKNRNLNMLFFWTLVNAIIVYFQFFFFNRFLIHLDIALIILSSVGFSILISKKQKMGMAILILMIISSGFLTHKEAVNAKNQIITEADIELIESLSYQTEDNAIIMSFSSEYSPWLLGYSNRTIIAPGLFDENLWSLEQWNTFWTTQSQEETIDLMSLYNTERPIYLYSGTKSFNNPCFTLFLEENSRKSYEYTC